MKNILGHYGDLDLFGSCGDLRYSYHSNDKFIHEVHYGKFGVIEKETKIEK